MQESVIVAGFGGQGVLFAGQALAYAAMDAGYQVTWMPSYGPEMRGGTAYCMVVVSDQHIGSPVVTQPTLAILLNGPSYSRFAPTVAEGGALIYNASLINEAQTQDDILTLDVPGLKLAEVAGDSRALNMVLVGAALAVRPFMTADRIKHTLDSHHLAKSPDMLAINCRALDMGAAFAESFISSRTS